MPSRGESRHWPSCKVLQAQMILARDLQKIQQRLTNKTLKQLHFPQGGRRTKCIFKTYHSNSLTDIVPERKIWNLLALWHHTSSTPMTNCRANTRTDRTHIRDRRHLAELPKIPYISAHWLTFLIHWLPPQTWTHSQESQVQRHQSQRSRFPSFLWLFMVVCFEFFSLWFSWHIYSTPESRRSLPSGRRKESQRKAVSSMRENSGRLPSPSSVREDKGGRER